MTQNIKDRSETFSSVFRHRPGVLVIPGPTLSLVQEKSFKHSTFKEEAITSYVWDEGGGIERKAPIMSGVLGCPLAVGFLQLLGLGELYKDS